MPTFKQEICPIGGKKINRDWFVDYAGKRIYFCTPDGPKKFKKNPEEYMQRFYEMGIELEDTPAPRHEHVLHRKGDEPEPGGEYQKRFKKRHLTAKHKKRKEPHKAHR